MSSIFADFFAFRLILGSPNKSDRKLDVQAGTRDM